jgi:hypothetical protein
MHDNRQYGWPDQRKQTVEEPDFRLTLATRWRKSADTHSSNDAAGAQARGEGHAVLLFPVLPRFMERGVTAYACC